MVKQNSAKSKSRGRLTPQELFGLLGLSGIFLYFLSKNFLGLGNADTYFHVRVGQELLSGNWKPWDSGHFNSYDHQDWVSTQWLSQILYGGAEQLGGLQLLNIVQGLTYLALVLTVYLFCRRLTGILPSALVTVVGVYALAPWVVMRPMVFSYMFMVGLAYYWYRAERENRVPWLSIPIFWFWAQVHGLWFIALVATAIWGLTIGLSRGLSTRDRSEPGFMVFPWGEERKVVLTVGQVDWRWPALPLLSAVATLLTFSGPTLWSVIFRLQSIADGYSEFGAHRFQDSHALALLLVLGGSFLGLAWRAYSRKFTPSLVECAAAFTALTLYLFSARTVPMGAAMMIPSLALTLAALTGSYRPSWKRDEKWALGGLMALLVAILVALNPLHPEKALGLPSWYDEQMSSLAPGTSIYTENDYATYLLYRHQDLEVIEHGYSDAFTFREVLDRFQVYRLEPNWQTVVRDKWDADIFFNRSDHYLTHAFKGEGWTVIEESEGYSLLAKPKLWTSEVRGNG